LIYVVLVFALIAISGLLLKYGLPRPDGSQTSLVKGEMVHVYALVTIGFLGAGVGCIVLGLN